MDALRLYNNTAIGALSTLLSLAESAFADRTASSLELIGDTPIYEAAERYPVDALRVFIREFHGTYTDESVVCNAGLAERKSLETLV